MKKLFVLTLISLLLISCSQSGRRERHEANRQPGSHEYTGGIWSSMNYAIEEKTIDSCEYIIIYGSEGRNIIHKANCRNPFHTR